MADPGPVTNTMIQDIDSPGFVLDVVEVEVALAPSLLCFEPAGYSRSMEDLNQHIPESECGQVSHVSSIPIGGEGFRVLECRSHRCT